LRESKDGRIVELEPVEFAEILQDYFGGRYTQAQLREVARWSKRFDAKTLALVYRYCTLNEETAYGKPPTIKRLNENLSEVLEAYPEVRIGSHNRQITDNSRLIEDAGGDAGDFLRAIVTAISEGRDPRSDEVVQGYVK